MMSSSDGSARRVSVSGASDFAGLVPAMLGCVPAPGSVVLAVFSGGRFAGMARWGAAEVSSAQLALARLAELGDEAMVVGYGTPADERLVAAVTGTAAGATAAGLRMLGETVVDGQRCCDLAEPERWWPVPELDATTRATFGATGRDATVAQAEVEARVEAGPQVVPESTQADAQVGARVWPWLLEGMDPAELSDREVAGCVAALGTCLRDVVVLQVCPIGEDAPGADAALVDRLCTLAGRVPDVWAVEVCCVLAAAAWWTGQPILARAALVRAARVDPGHRLTRLLALTLETRSRRGAQRRGLLSCAGVPAYSGSAMREARWPVATGHVHIALGTTVRNAR